MDEQTVSSVWNEIKNLLATTHAELEGSKQTLDSLKPPATPDQVQQVEKDLGVIFPGQLKEFYLQNAGQQGQGKYSFPMADIFDAFLSLKSLSNVARHFPSYCDEMAESWGIEKSQIFEEFQIPADFLSGDHPAVAWNSGWIPFAFSSNAGRVPFYLLIDADPPEGVNAGRVIGIGGEGDSLSLIAPDLLSLLIDIRDQLRQLEPEPSVDSKGGKGLERRRVLRDTGPRIWHSYLREDHEF